MDYCGLIKRVRELSGLSVSEFAKTYLHCGTTQYNRIIQYKTVPNYQIKINVIKNLERLLFKKDDELLKVIYAPYIVSKKINNANVAEILNSFDSKSLIKILEICVIILDMRSESVNELNLAKEITEFIKTPEGASLRNLKTLLNSLDNADNKKRKTAL